MPVSVYLKVVAVLNTSCFSYKFSIICKHKCESSPSDESFAYTKKSSGPKTVIWDTTGYFYPVWKGYFGMCVVYLIYQRSPMSSLSFPLFIYSVIFFPSILWGTMSISFWHSKDTATVLSVFFFLLYPDLFPWILPLTLVVSLSSTHPFTFRESLTEFYNKERACDTGFQFSTFFF